MSEIQSGTVYGRPYSILNSEARVVTSLNIRELICTAVCGCKPKNKAFVRLYREILEPRNLNRILSHFPTSPN